MAADPQTPGGEGVEPVDLVVAEEAVEEHHRQRGDAAEHVERGEAAAVPPFPDRPARVPPRPRRPPAELSGRVSPLALGYLVGLHLALMLLLWRSDTADLLRRALDPSPPHLTEHYHDMIAFHLRGDAALPPGGWRLFGDSLIEGLPASALSVPAANYGIGNDDSVGLAARLPLYESIGWADGIVLAVGINDLEHAPIATILTRYAALADAVPDGPRVLCHGVLPIDERAGDAAGRAAADADASSTDRPAGRSNGSIETLNADLRTLCEARGHEYVPPPAALAGPDGNLRAEFHGGDGVHLDADGYVVWIEHLDGALVNAPDLADTEPRSP